eukprot:scaffold427138_cov19-Prasinocladus_malaysianus.AAC.1
MAQDSLHALRLLIKHASAGEIHRCTLSATTRPRNPDNDRGGANGRPCNCWSVSLYLEGLVEIQGGLGVQDAVLDPLGPGVGV